MRQKKEKRHHRTQSFEMALNDEKKKVVANERSFFGENCVVSPLTGKKSELEVRFIDSSGPSIE